MENKISSNLNPEDTIKKNINRRKQFVDKDLSFFMDLPLPSWIELSIIDVCNRKCSFCPKSDENIAPDTYQKSSVFMFEKLANELKEIGFNGAFALCGYGEPYLHKNIYDIIKILSKVSRVEVVTNGDLIKPKTLQKSVEAGVSKILISMYDSQDQVEHFKKIIDDSGVSSGGILPITNLKFYPGYRVHLAKKIKKETKIITRTIGKMDNFYLSERTIKNGGADFVGLATAFLKNPNWVFNAASALNNNENIPKQYERALNK